MALIELAGVSKRYDRVEIRVLLRAAYRRSFVDPRPRNHVDTRRGLQRAKRASEIPQPIAEVGTYRQVRSSQRDSYRTIRTAT